MRPRFAVWVALALVAWPGVGATAERCDPSSVVTSRSTVQARASACYLEHRLPDIVTLYRGWLGRHPDDRAVRVELARMLTESGDLAGAEVEYDRLLAGGGSAADRHGLRRARADVRAWRGALAPAIAEYQALVADDPGDAPALLGLGLALQWDAKLPEAEAAMRAALAADPQHVEATRALAALLASPAYQARQADDERRAHPDDAARWVTAVDAFAKAEQFSVAETMLTTARQRWPRDSRLRQRQAALAAEQKARTAEQVATARAALAANDDDASARLALAAALYARGDVPGAIAAYDEHLRRHPEDTTARRQLARTLSWAGHFGAALGLYDDLVARTPADGELRLERARVLAWDGQLTESARELTAARAASPALAERTLGDVHRWGGDRAGAARHYRAAVLLGDGDEHAQAGEQFLANESGVSEALPTFTAMQDSDHFHQRRVVVEARQRHGLATDVGAAFIHGDYEQHGERLRVDRGRFSLARDFDDRWRASVAWTPATYDDDRTTHGAAVEVTRVLGPESQLSLGYDHYDLIDEVLTLAAADHHILQGDRARVQGRHVLPGRLELAGSASVAGYSDGNRLFAAQVSLARRLLRRPGLTLRWDAGYLDYAERSDRYWDPARYVTQGVSAVIRQEIVSHVNLQLEARVGYGDEEGQGSLERSFGGSLALAEVMGITAELGYRYGETGRVGDPGGGSNGYVAHSGTLAIRYRFGAT